VVLLKRVLRGFRAVGRRVGKLKAISFANSVARKYQAFSMVPRDRFVDTLMLAASIRIPGCVVECGVWKGGVIAGIADVLGPGRTYYLFDSFEGLPPAQAIDGPAALRWQSDTESPYYFDNCTADAEFARTAMSRSPAERVVIAKGWFQDTLSGFVPDQPIAFLHLDADWYDSTMQCLNALYDHVAIGGVIVIDDYYAWDGCSRAVHEFLASHQRPERIQQTPRGTCYLTKVAK